MDTEESDIVEEKETIVKVSARSKGLSTRRENNRLRAFKLFLQKFVPSKNTREALVDEFTEQKSLGKDWEKAKVGQEKGQEALKYQEAGKIAAEIDSVNQDTIEKFNKNVNEIFPEGTAENALLKFEKLLELNPEIAKKVDEIKNIRESIYLKHQKKIEVKSEQQ